MHGEIKQHKMQKAGMPSALRRILPARICDFVESVDFGSAEEIRLRRGRTIEIKLNGKTQLFDGFTVSDNEIERIFSLLCGGSLYAHLDTIARGYITLDGGIRVGIVGEASCDGAKIIGIRNISSFCIRIPHAIFVDAEKICDLIRGGNSVLVYSRAGVGKTTLLRSVASRLSDARFEDSVNVALVDTREELCFGLEGEGKRIDVLSGYPKREGIEIATRTMAPDVIVCDEIGVQEAGELLCSSNCGVITVASAHAGSLFELLRRNGIRELHDAGVFGYYVGISRSPATVGFDYDIVSRKEADAVLKDSG